MLEVGEHAEIVRAPLPACRGDVVVYIHLGQVPAALFDQPLPIGALPFYPGAFMEILGYAEVQPGPA